MSTKVYLISQPSVSRDKRPPNLRPLYEHGPVEVLVQSGENPAFHPDRVMRLIESRLKDFNADTDFIAHAGGDPLASVMVGIVLADMAADPEQGFESIKWLRYERGKDNAGARTHDNAKYIPVSIKLYPEDKQ